VNDVAPDGSPVELYARLSSLGEPELVHEAIPPGAEILELGAGAGRMTHRFIELGHPVTAVDSSAEMLARIRGATTVEADIVGLDLGRTFDCVLLASQLINVDDDIERAGFLATCARHVAPTGVVIIQRYAPAWADDPRPSDTVTDGLRIRLIDPRRDGERLHATVEYELEGQRWTHGPFASRILTDEELQARLLRGRPRLRPLAGRPAVVAACHSRRRSLCALRRDPGGRARRARPPAAVGRRRDRGAGARDRAVSHSCRRSASTPTVDAELARIASRVRSFEVRLIASGASRRSCGSRQSRSNHSPA
jgi:SAM-dependent methyltransferase